MIKGVIVFACICLSFISNAGTADLSIEFEIDATEVNYLQQGNFSLTISNLGPDVAGDVSDGSLPNAVLFSRQILNDNGFLDIEFLLDDTVQDCFIGLIVGEPFPGDDNTYFTYVISFPRLHINESITCYGNYAIGFEKGIKEFTWKTKSYLLDTDPNSSNNMLDFSLGIRPQIIPTNNLWSLGLMLLLILLFGLKARKEDL